MRIRLLGVLIALTLLVLITGNVSAQEEDIPPEPDAQAETEGLQPVWNNLCEEIYTEQGLESETWRCHKGDIIWYLEEANIPPDMRPDFLTVAACESAFDPNALGDGGMSKGLLQIRWDFWREWANTHSYTYLLDMQDTDTASGYVYFDSDDWNNPIRNFQLGLIINVFYDFPRYGKFWKQWSGHPDIPGCESKRDRLLSNLY